MFPGGPQAPLRAASGANYASFADVSGGNLVSEGTLENTLKGTHLQRDIYNVTFTEGHLQDDIYRMDEENKKVKTVAAEKEFDSDSVDEQILPT